MRIYDARFQNQFFCGASIMVAPAESTKDYIKVYLPSTDWYELQLCNDTYYKGNEEIISPSANERLPVFIKGGGIVAMQILVQNLTETPTDALQIHVYNGKKESQFVYY